MPLPLLNADAKVQIVTSAGAAVDTFGGGTQYADGATQANPTGTVALWLDTANAIRAVSAAKPLPVNVVAGSGGGLSVVDAAAWTTAVSNFVPGGGVFNDSAAALSSGQQGTQRLTPNRGAHVSLRTQAGLEALKSHNAVVPGTTNLGVLVAIANAAAPTFTENFQTGLSVDLAGNLRVIGGGLSVLDAAAWTTAVSPFTPGGGVFNDSATALTSGQQGTRRLTAQRAEHVNLRNNAGTEIGTTTTPVVIQGAQADNAALAGNPLRLGLSDGTALQTWQQAKVNGAAFASPAGLPIMALGAYAGSGNYNALQVVNQTNADGNALANGLPVGNWLSNGTNWDRVRGIAAVQGTTGAGLQAAGTLHQAFAHGANPASVTAGQYAYPPASRDGLPFVIGGHPNVISYTQNFTAAQTDTALVTVAAGTKIVVTGFLITCSNANTVNVSARLGFGTATVPAYGNAGILGSHPNIAPGSGFGRGGGGGMLGVGADNEDVRVTLSVPTSGSCDVCVTYYTAPS